MSKEASTEKASDKYWESNLAKLSKFKATYDLLVSLEAKIELLNNVLEKVSHDEEFIGIESWIERRLEELESEYQKLIEQHKL